MNIYDIIGLPGFVNGTGIATSLHQKDMLKGSGPMGLSRKQDSLLTI